MSLSLDCSGCYRKGLLPPGDLEQAGLLHSGVRVGTHLSREVGSGKGWIFPTLSLMNGPVRSQNKVIRPEIQNSKQFNFQSIPRLNIFGK